MDGGFMVFIIFAIAFGIFIFFGFYFSKDARARRALQAQERTPIDKVQEGAVVKIGGRVVHGEETVVAPLTGRVCACWEVIVQEYRSSGNSGSWREIIREQEARPFYLEDETGRALVRDSYPEFVLDKDGKFESGTWNDATEDLEAFLAEHGHESTGFLGFNKSIRYFEGVLEEGESAAVMGKALREIDTSGLVGGSGGGGGGYRQSPTIVVIEANDEGKLLVSDNIATLG